MGCMESLNAACRKMQQFNSLRKTRMNPPQCGHSSSKSMHSRYMSRTNKRVSSFKNLEAIHVQKLRPVRTNNSGEVVFSVQVSLAAPLFAAWANDGGQIIIPVRLPIA